MNQIFKSFLFLSFLLAICSDNLVAQFGPMQEFGEAKLRPTHAKLCDLDGDGDLDILCDAGLEEQIIWFENLGSGEFSRYKVIWEVPRMVGTPWEAPYSQISFDFGDFDQDGDLDVVAAEKSTGEVAWYENDGSEIFIAKHVIPSQGNGPSCLDAVDFDGDGDIDLLIGMSDDGDHWLFENSGEGEFNNQVLLNDWNSKIYAIEAADINGDQNLDFVVTGGPTSSAHPSGVAYCLNEGDFQFSCYSLHIVSGSVRSPKIADIDNDGDLDIYLSYISTNMQNGNLVWHENMGNELPENERFEGRFAGEYNSVPGCEAVEAFDIDGDGDLEILASYDLDDIFQDDVTSWHENTGGLAFGPPQNLHENMKGWDFLISGDITGDGITDLVMVSTARDQVAYSEHLGNGLFLETRELTQSKHTPRSMAQVDMNGDGLPDLLLTSLEDDKISYYQNQGDGNYGEQIVITNYAHGVVYTEATDFDGDGDLDIYWYASRTNNLRVFWLENTGDLNFTNNFLYEGSGFDRRILVDYDQDGDMDFVKNETGTPQIMKLFENTGDGQFTEHENVLVDNSASYNVFDTMDFDNDGDIDILGTAFNPYRIGWFENLGDNQISQFQIFDTLPHNTGSVKLIDLDMDGDLDIISIKISNQYNHGIGVHLNQGGETFTDPSFIFSSTMSIIHFDAVDINNDGLADIFLNDRPNHQLVSLLNEGEGNFGTPQHISNHPHQNLEFHSGDLDGDGDQDLFGFNSHFIGTFYTIENFHYYPNQARGKIFVDLNQNGILDSLDDGINFINIFSQPQSEYAFSYEDGRYHLFFEDTDGTPYQIQPEALAGWILTTDSSSYTIVADSLFSSIDSLDFGFYPDSVFTALEVDLTGGIPRCNWAVNYWINVSNWGTSLPSGILHLALDDSLTYSNCSQIPDSIAGQHIYWHIDSLFYFSNFQLDVEVIMPSFLSMDDTLLSSLTFVENAVLPGEAFIDSVQLEQIVICAYDPNDKSVNPIGWDQVGYIAPDQELEYLVRFQNTGNDTAFTVIIHDQLSPELDRSTFQPVSSSHQMQVYLFDDGRLSFSFYNILLPDSGINFPGSQGYVKFKIKPTTGLLPNTAIWNSAEIFFDYNPAIVTNTVQNTIECYVAPNPLITYNFPLLSAGFIDGTSYQWHLNGEPIPNAFGETHFPEANGIYTVDVGDANGCVTLSDPFNFISLNTSTVNDIQPLVYPNPTSGDLIIDFGHPLTGEYDLMIYNILGIEITHFSSISDEIFVLPKGSTGQGIFVAVLRKNKTGESLFMKKFVVSQ